MKKYSNLFVALGVTLFLLAVGMKSEAKAEICGGGTTIKDTITLNGCSFQFVYCIRCKPHYPGEITLTGYSALDGCGSGLNGFQIWDAIIAHISTTASFLIHCQPQTQIPPCHGTERLEVTFKHLYMLENRII